MFSDSFWASLNRLSGSMVDFVIVVLVLFAGKLFYNMTTKRNIGAELTQKDNPALAVALAGYLLGLGIAVSGGLTVPEFGPYPWVSTAIAGAVAVLMMRISLCLNDKLIMFTFSNDKEIIEDRNVGTGLVEAGGCIATGLMLRGVLTGVSNSPTDKLLDVGIYFLVGQSILIVASFLFQKLLLRDIYSDLENNDNQAIGAAFGGYLVAIGLIAMASLEGATSNILGELPTIGVVSVFGIILMVALRLIFDKVLLGGSLSRELKSKNVGAGAVAAASFVAVALLYSSAIDPADKKPSVVIQPAVLKVDTSEPVIVTEPKDK